MNSTTEPVPLLRCRVFRWHHFVVRFNPEGGRYQTCNRCGVDRGPVGYGPMTTLPWPGAPEHAM